MPSLSAARCALVLPGRGFTSWHRHARGERQACVSLLFLTLRRLRHRLTPQIHSRSTHCDNVRTKRSPNAFQSPPGLDEARSTGAKRLGQLASSEQYSGAAERQCCSRTSWCRWRTTFNGVDISSDHIVDQSASREQESRHQHTSSREEDRRQGRHYRFICRS